MQDKLKGATIDIDAGALRLALPHVGTEERRPALHAVMIWATGTVEATDGVTAVKIAQAATTPANVAIVFHNPKAVTAKKVERVRVQLSESGDGTVAHVDQYGRAIGASLAQVSIFDFPHTEYLWRRAATILQAPAPLKEIGWKPAVMARFGADPVQVVFGGSTSMAVIVWKSLPNALGLMMPCNLWDAAIEIRAERAALAESFG
jgi:hypothetical protein